MFDFTKKISLDEKNSRLYGKLKIVFYFFVFLSVIFLAYLILFPSRIYFFSFKDSKNNSLMEPRFQDWSQFKNGQLESDKKLFFSTVPLGDFSLVKVNIKLSNALKNFVPAADLSLKKSYEAFLYEEGAPLGFKDGTLLKNKSDYFLVSGGKLRKFESAAILSALEYSDKNFREVSSEELAFNSPGENIREAAYPDYSLFKVNDEYYILDGGQLKKFSSENSFLSHYYSGQAVEKNEEFLNNYSLSEDSVGFSDGSLVSRGESAYVISSGKFFPIDDVLTFINKGYRWEDVKEAGEDEMMLYKKSQLFTIDSLHPNGTVFKTLEDSKYYLVENRTKRLLPGENIAASWLSRKSPIAASEKGSETSASCVPRKRKLSFRSYFCEIPLEKFSEITDLGYEFQLSSGENISVESIKVNFIKSLNWKNFQSALFNIVNKIKLNYAAKTAA
jgi:hypothetical protein